jgi:hypothetical protein
VFMYGLSRKVVSHDLTVIKLTAPASFASSANLYPSAHSFCSRSCENSSAHIAEASRSRSAASTVGAELCVAKGEASKHESCEREFR